jgi:acyl-CoA synthetase (AMP-forming)/AMP-acid ligase II
LSALVQAQTRLVDAASGREVTGHAFVDAVGRLAGAFDALPAGYVFAFTRRRLDPVLRYLAVRETGRAVALLDPDLPAETRADLVHRYRPPVVLGLDRTEQGMPASYSVRHLEGLGTVWVGEEAASHPDLGVMLATSGSTGSPKLVRLSWGAVEANARSICQVLQIDEKETAPTSLPLFYSYGLSVLNSHLWAGATIVLTEGSVVDRAFWHAFDGNQCTSLAGVPYHYSILSRLRFDPSRHPSVRTLTQAGGRLAPEVIRDFVARIGAVGGRMYVMYGQTEATARITVVPPDRLLEKLGSAGLPIPGGRVEIRELDPASRAGEVIYTGRNVMMGYAERAEDLGRGDDLGGVLPTGDLGFLDADGFLFLTGRSKRIGKVFGVRVNLDDIEHLLRDRGPVAALAAGDAVTVWMEDGSGEDGSTVARWLSEHLHLHASGFDVRLVDQLPLLGNGKIDYRLLEGR